ncbi:MAG TPA: universal stress protein [Solirubrobacteraceae bacterium]|nr:universal stress protein [Solirubrobacteraceae bacterium]
MSRSRETIVCALDGSPASDHLALVGAALAEVLDADLECVHVLAGQPAGEPAARGAHARAGPREQAEAAARAMLSGTRDVARVHSEFRLVRYGDPARRIATIAEQRGASLIVVGTRSHDGAPDAVLGSVSSRLAADAPCPVLVVPPRVAAASRPARWAERTLVCGIDGSEPGWGAARHAAALAARLRGSLLLVTIGAGPAPSQAEIRRRLAAGAENGSKASAPEVRQDLRSGDPAWELERVAAASTAPLIAIGSRGRGPLDAGLLGPVARRVLRAARRPILVFPATALLDDEG